MTYTFLLTDLDYKIKTADISPTIRLFGKTKEKSVQISITDFYPYFYVAQKKGLEDFIEENDIVGFADKLLYKKGVESTIKSV